MSSPHPPNFCILVLSHAVANSGLQDFAVVRLEEGLSSLSQSLSACDRILNTPIPLSYTRQARAALVHVTPISRGPWCHCSSPSSQLLLAGMPESTSRHQSHSSLPAGILHVVVSRFSAKPTVLLWNLMWGPALCCDSALGLM